MFKPHRSSDGQFYFTLTARNGQVLLTSETYKTKIGLKKGIDSVIQNIDRYRSSHDKKMKLHDDIREL